jgi:hypothetical protein
MKTKWGLPLAKNKSAWLVFAQFSSIVIYLISNYCPHVPQNPAPASKVYMPNLAAKQRLSSQRLSSFFPKEELQGSAEILLMLLVKNIQKPCVS